MKQFIAVEEARQIILHSMQTQPVERIAFGQALGRTLAEPVISRDTIPPFDNSAMDGFAVRVEDVRKTPILLPVVEEIPAGHFPEHAVGPGTCSRIMTGAPIPKGADAVVLIEWTSETETGLIRFERAPLARQHIRYAGEDLRPGQEIIEAGTIVTPPVVGMLATLGYAEVAVRKAPTISVLSTGDELVDVSETPGPGQIRNSNGPALAAQVQSAGGSPKLLPIVRDNRSDIRKAIQTAMEADVILISGGVSVGDYDLIKQELDGMGLELLFWKVRQRPGKPLAFGFLNDRPVFGLPGNPVSSAICFEQYVRPALARMLGRKSMLRPRHPAILAEGINKQAGLHHFVRGKVYYDDAGRTMVQTTGAQGSHLYSSMVKADCIIHLPEKIEHPAAQTQVEIEWLTW
jgi:molybdopterin molybdotransferase